MKKISGRLAVALVSASALMPAVAVAGPWSPPVEQMIEGNAGAAPGALDANGHALFALERLSMEGYAPSGLDVLPLAPNGFGTVERIFAGPAGQPNLVHNERGEILAAWLTDNQDPGWLRQEAVVAVRGADGRWSAPQQLDDGNLDDPQEHRPHRKSKMAVSLAIGPAGHAVATWVEQFGYGDQPWVVKASVRPPGGAFGPAQALAQGASGGYPHGAIDAHGGAVVVWPVGGTVYAARRAAADAGFAAPVPISHPARPADQNRYAFDAFQGPRGDIAVVYGSTAGLEVTVQRAGAAAFEEPEVILAQSAHVPLAVDRAGNVMAGWALRGSVEVAVRPAGGRFTTIAVPGTGNGDSGPAALGFDASDRAVVVWHRGGIDSGLVLAARAKPGGRFGGPQLVAERGRAYTGELLFDSSGDGLLAWLEPAGGRVTRLRVSRYDGDAAETPAPAAKAPSARLDGRRVQILVRVAGDVRMAVTLRRHGAHVAGTGWRKVRPGLRRAVLPAPRRRDGLRAVVRLRDRLGRRAKASASVRP